MNSEHVPAPGVREAVEAVLGERRAVDGIVPEPPHEHCLHIASYFAAQSNGGVPFEGTLWICCHDGAPLVRYRGVRDDSPHGPHVAFEAPASRLVVPSLQAPDPGALRR